MKICPKCSAENEDISLFCVNCGEDLSAVKVQDEMWEDSGFSKANDSQTNMYNNFNPNNNGNQYNRQQYPQTGTQPQYQAGQGAQGGMQYRPNDINSTPYIVWSVVNLICCCLPLGIASLIFAIQINSASSYEEAENKKNTAMILCIIGTVLGFVIGLFNLFVVLFSAAL